MSIEFDVKVLREELDLLTRFHHENKSNFECLVEDNIAPGQHVKVA